jgi:hypothetical protein
LSEIVEERNNLRDLVVGGRIILKLMDLIFNRGWEFFSSPPLPDRLWGPPSLLSNGYQGKAARA